MTNLKPMLAVEAQDIKFPVFASFKIDGIRVLCKDKQSLSRSLKQIPNKHFEMMMAHPWLHGLDGEVVVGEPNHENVMQKTTSGLMSVDGSPNFTYYVFDVWTKPDMPYEERYKFLQSGFGSSKHLPGFPFVQLLEQKLIHNPEELKVFETEALKHGYEGIMVRAPDSPYKFGRSTAKQGYLLKVKRFVDGEAVVVGVIEKMHNANELQVDELGYAKRSSCKDGLVPSGVLGALECIDIISGKYFCIGTGFNDEDRGNLWESPPLGSIVKYKHFPNGVKNAPRFPVFLGFRDVKDMEPYKVEHANRLFAQYNTNPKAFVSTTVTNVPLQQHVFPRMKKALMPRFSEQRYVDHVDMYRIAATLNDTYTSCPPITSTMTNEELLDLVRTYFELCPHLEEVVNRFSDMI